jgi:hypothetical protein
MTFVTGGSVRNGENRQRRENGWVSGEWRGVPICGQPPPLTIHQALRGRKRLPPRARLSEYYG